MDSTTASCKRASWAWRQARLACWVLLGPRVATMTALETVKHSGPAYSAWRPTALPASPASRRLRSLVAGITTMAAAPAAAAAGATWDGTDPFTSRGTNEPDDFPMRCLPHKLAQKPDGRVEEFELAELAAREAAAAATRDYRLAAQLRDLQGVLHPCSRMSLADCMAPASTDERYEFFLRHGFCVIPQAVEPEQLRRMQAAWERVSPAARAQWESDKVGGEGQNGLYFAKPPVGGSRVYRTFFDIPKLFEQDDVFLDLIDRPKVVSLVSRLVGLGGLDVEQDQVREIAGEATKAYQGLPASRHSPYHGIAQAGGGQARTVPAKNGNEHGYISWHRDKPPADGWPLPNYRVIKVIINLWDIPPDGGGTAIVPGSFRLPEGPRQTLAGRFVRGGQEAWLRTDGREHQARPEQAPELDHTCMPNHVVCAPVAAGTALCFDTASWHTGMPNTSDEDRRGVILGYRSSQASTLGHACGLSRASLERLAARDLLPVVRRRLMGLPDDGF